MRSNAPRRKIAVHEMLKRWLNAACVKFIDKRRPKGIEVGLFMKVILKYLFDPHRKTSKWHFLTVVDTSFHSLNKPKFPPGCSGIYGIYFSIYCNSVRPVQIAAGY